jgi:hypothetical protein
LNLLDSNPLLSSDTLFTLDSILVAGGQLKLGPDGKIYYSTQYYDGIHYPYPYSDSAYSPVNMNLGVINSPDSIGASCNFLPFSFYLNGKRSYLGLPNNPIYDLPAVGGSICDSLTGIENLSPRQNSKLYVYYHSGWKKTFVNAWGLMGKNYSLRLIDISGREIFVEKGMLTNNYFTKDIDCGALSNGIYIIVLETEREKMEKKIILN